MSAYLVAAESIGTWRFRAKQAVETPQDLPWITGVLWDETGGQAVGKAGFHAAPDADGMVEIGYAVDPAFRRQGFARAALELLLDRARREPEARVLRATVAPANAASLALVHQYPFLETGEQWDDEDGLEIIYELPVDGPGPTAP
nr:GNAT family N-acetyltransferase [Nocardioides luti]